MIKNLGQTLVKFFKGIGDFFLKTDIGRILGLLTGVVVFLKTIGIWEDVLKTISSYWNLISGFLLSQVLGIPLYFWVLILLLLYWLHGQSKYLRLVSGEFLDDFNQGLNNWEYGGEGWKTEYEDGEPLLSVSESPDGGISKKGFSWSDYQFSFGMKLINKNAGWIVRAENRNKYLMIQFNLENINSPMLRLHLRIPPSDRPYQWVVIQENIINQTLLSKLDWMKVRIVVLGSNIDVYINDKHEAHYFIADPIRWQEDYDLLNKHELVGEPDKKGNPAKGSYIASINYSAGKVGFRCYGDEHAHFRNVRVKPLL